MFAEYTPGVSDGLHPWLPRLLVRFGSSSPGNDSDGSLVVKVTDRILLSLMLELPTHGLLLPAMASMAPENLDTAIEDPALATMVTKAFMVPMDFMVQVGQDAVIDDLVLAFMATMVSAVPAVSMAAMFQ